MGYYTDYTISIVDGSYDEEIELAIQKDIENLDGGGWEQWTADEWYSNRKWYDQDIDMYRISMKYPGILFCVHGNGDDADDVWDEYWQDGRMQHCHMKIPPYDKEQMRELYIDQKGRLCWAPFVQTDQELDIDADSLPEI